MKAKFISKSYDRYDRNAVYLEYEYKGRRYEVYEHMTKGNEPLRWQHANAQARIDRAIELEEKTKNNKKNEEVMSFAESLDYFFELVDN